MKQSIIFILCCLVSITCFPQTENSEITIGITHSIESSILNQERMIQIYVPDDYEKSKKSYPVLYILDGQWYFLSGVSIQKALRTPGAIPEMIVVGVKNSNPLRRTLFGDENEKFTNFLKN